MDSKERMDLAKQAGINEQYLYQCLEVEGRQMDATRAAQVEALTGGRIRRWQLRRKDWHITWPELVEAEGAPPIPEPKAA